MRKTIFNRVRFFIILMPLALLAALIGAPAALGQVKPEPVPGPGPANAGRPVFRPRPNPEAAAQNNKFQPPPPAQPAQPVTQGEDTLAAMPEYHAKGLTVFYMGRRNSEIEPCGCVKNQLGGIQYEATLIRQVPDDQSIRVGVGGWNVPGMTPEGAMKSGYALIAMAGELAYDAVNLGSSELELSKEWFDHLASEHPEAIKNILSCNVFLKNEPEKLAFAPHKIVERKLADGKSVKCGIIGVTTENTVYQSNAGAPGNFTIGEWYGALKNEIAAVNDRVDVLVVMAAGVWPDMIKIANEFPEIDLLLSTSPSPDYNQKYAMQNGVIMAGNFGGQGKMLGRLDLFNEKEDWVTAANPDLLEVSPKKLAPVPELVQLIADYKDKTKDLSMMQPPDAKHTFRGAISCRDCHAAQYADWEKQRHSHAMQTLVNKGSQFDPSCLKCHTLGFQKDNGYYNFMQSRMMANVQCENCHGPAWDHVDKEILYRSRLPLTNTLDEREKLLQDALAVRPKKEVPEATCRQCHYGDNDPHFDYEKKIHLVNHKGGAKAEAAAAH